MILPTEDADPAQVWDDATALQLAERADWSRFSAAEVAVAGARTLASFGDTGRPELLALAISLLEDAYERAADLPESEQADTALCLGEALCAGSLIFDEPSWLPEAIAAGEAAVQLGTQAWAWIALCETYRAAFRTTAIREHLTDALRCARAAVDLAQPTDLAALASNLGAVATQAASDLNDPDLLDEACAAAATAVRRSRHRDPHRAVYLTNLAHTQETIAARDASAAVARRAVYSAGRALLKDPSSANALLVAAQCHETLGLLTLSERSLAEASELLRRAEITAHGTPQQTDVVLERSRLAQVRFERDGDTDRLTEAARHAQRAVALQGGRPGATAHALLNLAVCRTRACESGLAGPRIRVTQLVSIALDRASPAERPQFTADAGLVWLSHYERTGASASLRTAINLLREAASIPQTRPRSWSNLAGALLSAVDADPSEALVHEATDSARRAYTDTPPKLREDRTAYEAVLASCLEASFRISHDPAELREAADHARRAARRLDPRSPDATAIRTNCAIALRTSYEHSGRRSDLTLAAQLLEDASSSAGAGALPTCLSQQAATLRTRFEASGDPTDLKKALDTAAKLETCGARITRAGAATLSACWLTAYANLANVLRVRASLGFGRTTAALHAAEASVRLAGEKDRHRPAYLSGLALVLAELGRHREASNILRRAVQACPQSSPDRHFYRTNLAASLRDEFAAGASRRQLREAIRILRLLPASDAPWSLLAQAVLGDCLSARGAPGDRQLALACWTSVRDTAQAPFWLRLVAAMSAADTLATGGTPDWSTAATFYRRAIELHVRSAWHGLAWASRRRFLAARPTMGADAAAAALRADTDAGSALTLLETGRDIVWRGRTERRNSGGDHPLMTRLYRMADELDALDRRDSASAAPRRP